jgi:hypothetical protein
MGTKEKMQIENLKLELKMKIGNSAQKKKNGNV